MSKNAHAISAFVQGIGVLGPGLADWESAKPVLAGLAPYTSAATVIPPPQILPPAERRRASDIIKLTLATSVEALAAAKLDVQEMPSVFSFSNGDGNNCHVICETLASSDRQLSPTRFHNSVHNAAAGYWSIAMKAMATSSVLCAYDASFGAGLVEAMTQVAVDATPCILMASDTPYPEPVHNVRPIPDNFGLALVLTPARTSQSLARLEIGFTEEEADRMAVPAMEQLRLAFPTARGLPLLSALAQGQDMRVILSYLDELQLAVTVSPC